jgi:hypothetical protein
MRKIISLICLLLPTLACAGETHLRSNAPEQYVVVRGDTLWDIAARFFSDPWQWQQIWGMNRDTICDPHWIYPGDIVHLDRRNGTLHVSAQPAGSTIKLSPHVHTQPGQTQAIPPVPLGDIAPFLKRPLVVGENELAGAPVLVATLDRRVVLGDNDTAFFRAVPTDQGSSWQLYRPGKALTDPDTHELLGHEAVYLGEARVEQFGDPSSVRITRAVQEVRKGDRMIASRDVPVHELVPHAPVTSIGAKVISIHGESPMAGQHAVITLNKGARDGIESGHVLALSRQGEVVHNDDSSLCGKRDAACDAGRDVSLPERRYGLILVFRTFERVSYALVMQTQFQVERLDLAKTP